MKNLKIWLFLVAVIWRAAAVFGQETTETLDESIFTKPPRSFRLTHQVDINFTNFVAKILRENRDELDAGSPYTIGYSVFYNNFGLRTGAGWRSSENLNAGGSNNNAPIIVQNSQKDFRLGLIYQLKIAKHWRATFALDGQYGWGDNTLKSFFTDAFGNQQDGKIALYSTKYGGGASVGVQYFITDRVGFGTESTGFWQRAKTVQKNDFYLPIGIAPDQTKQTIDLSPPAVLYFFFRF